MKWGKGWSHQVIIDYVLHSEHHLCCYTLSVLAITLVSYFHSCFTTQQIIVWIRLSPFYDYSWDISSLFITDATKMLFSQKDCANIECPYVDVEK
jgi:hypothetical protein